MNARANERMNEISLTGDKIMLIVNFFMLHMPSPCIGSNRYRCHDYVCMDACMGICSILFIKFVFVCVYVFFFVTNTKQQHYKKKIFRNLVGFKCDWQFLKAIGLQNEN